ncbi:uncharacterized protein cubi_00981 [Cryptosporidium ubiquitum]|uniref:Uncharacterized protein n=1 Tax=Cryptosporidium ubiquitum TaxID=857276 RepID=A0A1J4MCU7_9CRYT|nr:uncharacterized protein cubi_00981 [Cryptosporidium ubiquitum]OII70836.1 hypothetical protein cubi_00981 [Cryptosporidium ubiquitum]
MKFFLQIYSISFLLYYFYIKIHAPQSVESHYQIEFSLIKSRARSSRSRSTNNGRNSRQSSEAAAVQFLEDQMKSPPSPLSPSKPSHLRITEFLSSYGVDDQMYVGGVCDDQLREYYYSKLKKIVGFFFLVKGEYKHNYGTNGPVGRDRTLHSKFRSQYATLITRFDDIFTALKNYMELLFNCLLYIFSHSYREIEVEPNDYNCTRISIYFFLMIMEITNYMLKIFGYLEKQFAKLIAQLLEKKHDDVEARIQAIYFALEMIRETKKLEEEKFSRSKDQFDTCKSYIKTGSLQSESGHKRSIFDDSVSESSSSTKSSTFMKLKLGKMFKKKGKDKKGKKGRGDQTEAEQRRDDNEDNDESPFWKLSLLTFNPDDVLDDDVFL